MAPKSKKEKVPPKPSVDDDQVSVDATSDEPFLRKTLEEYKQRVNDLREEVKSLNKELEKKDEDSREIIQFLKDETEKKTLIIANLEECVEKQRVDFETQTEESNREWETKCQGLEQELKVQKQILEEERNKLQEELSSLREFKEMKFRMDEELGQARAELQANEESHRQTVAALERRYYEEKARSKKETKAVLDDMKKRSQEEAMEKLDHQSKKIMTENKRIVDELQFQTKQTMEFTKQMRQADQDKQRLSRQLELSESQLKKHSQRGMKQQREIRDLNGKVKTLEVSLSQVVRDFERERESTHIKKQKEVDNLKMEAAGLRHLVKLKSRELQNIKRLSQIILKQRTELEEYFLQSLEHVKAEVKKRKEAAKKQQASQGSVRLPSISQPQHVADHDGRQPKGVVVDIRDLSWEDKERVLRLLFLRMNNSQGPLAFGVGKDKGAQPIGSHQGMTELEGMIKERDSRIVNGDVKFDPHSMLSVAEQQIV